MENIWYKDSADKVYTGQEPPFIECAGFDFVQYLERNFTQIQAEATRLLENLEYEQKTNPNAHLVSKKNGWNTVTFKYWSIPDKKNISKSPEIKRFLDNFPNIVSASLSYLDPKTSIFPHYGDTNAIYRCHLGIRIPGFAPECAMIVDNTERSWEEGKVIAFLDAHYHRAQNMTSKPRIVFMFDALRPEFAHAAKEISIYVRSILSVPFLLSRFPFLKLISTKHLISLMRIYLRLLWPVHTKIGSFTK